MLDGRYLGLGYMGKHNKSPSPPLSSLFFPFSPFLPPVSPSPPFLSPSPRLPPSLSSPLSLPPPLPLRLVTFFVP